LTFQSLEGVWSAPRSKKGGEAVAGPLTIGQVAKTTGVTAKTIRYYEAIGVLPVPDRTVSGYRQYDEAAVERLRFISRARSLGLPLQRLRILTSALNGVPRLAFRPRLLELVHEQLSAVQHQIGELDVLRQQLEQISHRLRTSARRRGTGFCRCLETEDEAKRSVKRESRPLRRS
jgi:DNA-binding transcriptional MerR regulator